MGGSGGPLFHLTGVLAGGRIWIHRHKECAAWSPERCWMPLEAGRPEADPSLGLQRERDPADTLTLVSLPD